MGYSIWTLWNQLMQHALLSWKLQQSENRQKLTYGKISWRSRMVEIINRKSHKSGGIVLTVLEVPPFASRSRTITNSWKHSTRIKCERVKNDLSHPGAGTHWWTHFFGISNKTTKVFFFLSLLALPVSADTDILSLLPAAKQCSMQAPRKCPHLVWKTQIENGTYVAVSSFFLFRHQLKTKKQKITMEIGKSRLDVKIPKILINLEGLAALVIQHHTEHKTATSQ